MAWDDTKQADDLIPSSEWNTMVTDQKGRVIGTSIDEAIADTSGNLPAAGTSGRLFFETDTGRTLYDNGTSWVEVGLSESQISLANLSSNSYADLSDGSSFPIPNTDLSNSSLTVANTSISLGGSGTPEADNLAGNNGTSGQVLQTDGSNTSWVDVGAPEIVAFETGHTEWATGLSDEEVHRFSNPNGFDLKQLEMRVKGGGTADAELKARLEENGAPQSLIETLTDSTVVLSVAFSSEGFLAVGSQDNNVYVYDTSNFSLQETLTDSNAEVNSVAFSSEGFLASGSSDDNTYVYDTSNFSLQETLTDSTISVYDVAFSSEGFLAVGKVDLYVYDTSNFSLQETLTDSTDRVNSVAFSSEGFLAAGGDDNNVYVYDTSDFTEITDSPLTDSTEAVNSVAFSSEGFLASGSSDDNTYVYDTSDFTEITDSPLTDSFFGTNSVAFSSEGFLAVGSGNDDLYVYDTSNFSLQETLTDSNAEVNSVAFSSEGFLASGSSDDNTYVYDKETPPGISVSAGNSDSTGYTIDKDPVVIRLTTNETVDASLIVRGEKK